MARMANKLPRGLAEFEGSLADLKYAPGLITRLRDLPEHGFDRDFVEFEAAMQWVAVTEQSAANARDAARRIAAKIWNAAKRNWSTEELQKATGYDEED